MRWGAGSDRAADSFEYIVIDHFVQNDAPFYGNMHD